MVSVLYHCRVLPGQTHVRGTPFALTYNPVFPSRDPPSLRRRINDKFLVRCSRHDSVVRDEKKKNSILVCFFFFAFARDFLASARCEVSRLLARRSRDTRASSRRPVGRRRLSVVLGASAINNPPVSATQPTKRSSFSSLSARRRAPSPCLAEPCVKPR